VHVRAAGPEATGRAARSSRLEAKEASAAQNSFDVGHFASQMIGVRGQFYTPEVTPAPLGAVLVMDGGDPSAVANSKSIFG
jgi:hypothetical protein